MKYQVNMKDWETPMYRPLLWSTVFPYGSLTCWGWSPAQDISLPPSLSCVRGTFSQLLGQWSWLVIWKPQRQDESEHSEQHPTQAVESQLWKEILLHWKETFRDLSVDTTSIGLPGQGSLLLASHLEGSLFWVVMYPQRPRGERCLK